MQGIIFGMASTAFTQTACLPMVSVLIEPAFLPELSRVAAQPREERHDFRS